MHNFQKIMRVLLTAVLLWSTSAVTAANDSPVGKWRSIDDKTGKAKSIIEITLNDGTLEGKIIELLDPSKPNPLCEKCKGEKANQPITGMTIIWGVTKQGDYWGKGKILDPKKGKTYKVKLSLENDGQKLKVRGYIGTPALGRTQFWERVSDN